MSARRFSGRLRLPLVDRCGFLLGPLRLNQGRFWQRPQPGLPWLGLMVLSLLVVLTVASYAQPGSIRVRIERWIGVQQMHGEVSFLQQGRASRPARLNDRLRRVGDGLATGEASAATLEVDTQIGTIDVMADTAIRIQSLEIGPNDGRITRLAVDRGQARLRLRPFNNPESQLDLETPAGVSSVRGTEFGLVVFPDGRMGVATLEGRVVTSAQGQEVDVQGGFQNITVPGEPPSQPIPFSNEPRLEYQVERVIRRGIRRILLTGQVDPTSSVLIKGQPQETDRDGRFTLLLPAPSRLRLAVTVVTALGQTQTYELDLI